MLETMLRQHGFERRKQAGSHITYVHPDYPSVMPFTLISGTDKIDTQIQAADKCLEVRDIIRREREAKLEAQKEASRQAATAATKDSPFIKTLDHIPEGIEAEEQEGIVVLRDSRLPAIGNVASLDIDPAQLITTCSAIQERATGCLAQLDCMNGEYETAFRVEDGALTIEQTRYGLKVEIPAYDPASEQGFDEAVIRFRALLDSYDFIFRDGVVYYLDVYKENGTATSKVINNEDTEWLLIAAKDGSEEHHRNIVHLSPHGRMAPKAFFRFVDLASDLFLSGVSNRISLRDIFRMVSGIELKIPRIDRKTPGNTMIITHPFFPEFERKLPTPRSIPRLEKMWDDFVNASSAVDEVDIWNTLETIRERMEAVESACMSALKEYDHRMREDIDRWDREVMNPTVLKNFRVEHRGNLTLTDCGRVINSRFCRITGQDPGVFLRVIFCASRDGELMTHVNPEDISKAKGYVRDCGFTPGV